jgi:hypothetical protein
MGISTWCLLFLKGMWELTLVLTSRYTALMIFFFVDTGRGEGAVMAVIVW